MRIETLPDQEGVVGGSWVVISGVISTLIWVLGIVTLLISLLITTMNLPVSSTLLFCTVILAASGY